MNNKGFTLVELLVVIAILALATGLIASNFITLTDKREVFEDDTLAKHIAEAGYAFYDSKKNKPDGVNRLNFGCQPIETLIKAGYLSEDQGLLTKYNNADDVNADSLQNFYYKTDMESGQKTTRVYKRTAKPCGSDCCGSKAKEIYKLPN